MQEDAFLIGLAQLAIVLTGFISVFIVVVARDGALSRPDRLHFIVMMSGSLSVVGATLLPFALFFFELPDETIWKTSNIVMLSLVIGLFVAVNIRILKMPKAERKDVGLLHFVSSYALALLAIALFLYGAIGRATKAAYIAALIARFFVGLLGFLTFSLEKFLFGD